MFRYPVLALLAVLLTPGLALAQRSPASAATLGELSRSLQDLSQKVSASVVQIFVTGYAPPDEDDPQAAGQPMFERSSGSGVDRRCRRLHRDQRARRRERHADRGRAAVCGDRRRTRPLDPRPARTHRRRADRRDRPRDRHRGGQDRGEGPAGAAPSATRTRCGPGSWSWRSAARSGSTRRSRSASSAPWRAS